jgi:hypothetical protein
VGPFSNEKLETRNWKVIRFLRQKAVSGDTEAWFFIQVIGQVSREIRNTLAIKGSHFSLDITNRRGVGFALTIPIRVDTQGGV